MRLLLLLPLLSGCCDEVVEPECAGAKRPARWSFPTTIRAVSDDPLWQSQLDKTVYAFDFGVGATILACRTEHVRVDPAGEHIIRLVDQGCAAGETAYASANGDEIVIVGRASSNWIQSELRRVIEHELGHVFGLGHANAAYGESVMTDPPGPYQQRDVDAIQCRLGCGPCDPTTDPYSL